MVLKRKVKNLFGDVITKTFPFSLQPQNDNQNNNLTANLHNNKNNNNNNNLTAQLNKKLEENKLYKNKIAKYTKEEIEQRNKMIISNQLIQNEI